MVRQSTEGVTMTVTYYNEREPKERNEKDPVTKKNKSFKLNLMYHGISRRAPPTPRLQTFLLVSRYCVRAAHKMHIRFRLHAINRLPPFRGQNSPPELDVTLSSTVLFTRIHLSDKKVKAKSWK